MGRRSFVSTSLINRMLASSRAEKRREENRQLIQAQNGPKELEPEYSIDYIDFNEQSRSTKIHFRKTVHYRTIDRYIQQNYERYPIYSGWKTKTSSFSKSIKLTNEELENLYRNADEFLRDFAVEIITKLPEELTPSWYIKESIDTDYIQKIKTQEDLKKSAYTELQNNLQNNNEQIAEIKQTISLKNDEKGKAELKVTKLSEKISKAEKREKNLLLSFVTLFVYNYLRSEKRIFKLTSKKDVYVSQVNIYSQDIENLNGSIDKLMLANNEAQKNYNENVEKFNVSIRDLRAEWDQKKREVTPLPTSYVSDNITFTPLKILSGMSYTKISGCFVIRNRENHKCYVGQSTDVIKRLKQLFKGTIPTNMVFTEDYYSSQDKENLFEFMISPQNSKDKLDSVQKKLIEEYDAFNSGYNGTSGKTPITPTFDSSKTSI